MRKILFINDTYDQQNWGAQATSYAIKKIILSKSRNVDILTKNFHWMQSKWLITPKFLGNKIIHDNSSLFRKLSKNYPNLPLVADEFDYVADQWLSNLSGDQIKELISELENIDLVIFNGEGSVYRNNFTAIKGLFLLWFCKTRLNKPCYFVNGSVTITHVDPILPAMVKKTFQVIDGVALREPVSQRNLLEFYPMLDTKVVPDAVFSLYDEININNDVGHKKILDIKSEYLCFSPPMLLTAIPGIYRMPKEQSYLFQLVNNLKKIVPQVVILGKEPRDLILKQLAEDTGSIFVGPDYNFNQVVEIIRNSKLLISGRYHHLIFASIVGTLSVPLDTSSHKIHGLCELFSGTLGEVFDCTDLQTSMPKILDQTQELICSDYEYGVKFKNLAKQCSLNVYEYFSSLI